MKLNDLLEALKDLKLKDYTFKYRYFNYIVNEKKGIFKQRNFEDFYYDLKAIEDINDTFIIIKTFKIHYFTKIIEIEYIY